MQGMGHSDSAPSAYLTLPVFIVTNCHDGTVIFEGNGMGTARSNGDYIAPIFNLTLSRIWSRRQPPLCRPLGDRLYADFPPRSPQCHANPQHRIVCLVLSSSHDCSVFFESYGMEITAAIATIPSQSLTSHCWYRLLPTAITVPSAFRPTVCQSPVATATVYAVAHVAFPC